MLSLHLLALLLASCNLLAQPSFYAGAIGGVATLSADGTTLITGTSAAASSYKPENDAALNLFFGWHLNNWVTIQGNYVWNRNSLAMSSIDGDNVYEQQRNSSQHAAVLDGLLYFRPITSRLRPYLSAGICLVRVASESTGLLVRGSPSIPASSFSATKPAVRSAVGMDVRLHKGVFIRYSFSETIRANDFSGHLTPRGSRNLANFQNLVGLGFTF